MYVFQCMNHARGVIFTVSRAEDLFDNPIVNFMGYKVFK